MHGIERSPVSAIISASPLATDCCIGFPTAIIFLALRLSMPVRFVSSTTADILSRWPSPVHTHQRTRPLLHSEHSANETRMIQQLARVSNPSPFYLCFQLFWLAQSGARSGHTLAWCACVTTRQWWRACIPARPGTVIACTCYGPWPS